MLSNDILDQLVSLSSKLDTIVVTEDNRTQEKISHLKSTITALADCQSELSETDIQNLIHQLQVALVDLEEATNKRIEMLAFVDKIAPK